MGMMDIVGGIAGPILGYIGQRQTNDANKDIAHDTNVMSMEEAARNREFQQTSAREQMAFQERMSNTQMQRGAADLKAAGFNPILATQGQQASAPQGAAVSGSQASFQKAEMKNALEGFGSTAQNIMNLMKGQAELGLLKENQKNVRADTQTKQASKANIDADTLQKTKGMPESDAKGELYKFIYDSFRGGLDNWKKFDPITPQEMMDLEKQRHQTRPDWQKKKNLKIEIGPRW